MAALSGQITMSGSSMGWRTNVTTDYQDYYLIAHPDNADPIYIGNNGSDAITTDTGIPLVPTAIGGIRLPASLLNQLYVIGTSTDKLCWMKA